MAALTVQQALAAGITLSLNAAASGDTVANPRGRTFFIAKNGDASAKTLTIPAQTTSRPADGQFPSLTIPDISVVIAAGARRSSVPCRSRTTTRTAHSSPTGRQSRA